MLAMFVSFRKAYIEFLERPDHKQTFVTQWQKVSVCLPSDDYQLWVFVDYSWYLLMLQMYNEEIADDMRADGDMKAELHQQSEVSTPSVSVVSFHICL